jgi:hypothetical protein
MPQAAIEPTPTNFTSAETSNSRPSSERQWVWAPRIDPNCGEYGLFVNRNNQINIEHGSSLAAVTGMRVILNNQFAPMPVCGHGYASAQFIGRGSTEFSMQIAGIGDEKLSEIQAMHEELEENARLFRRFEGASRVNFIGNEFLELAGIRDGLITSIDTETDPAGTNLYRMQISFTSDGHHTEGFNQEMYVENNIAVKVLEGLLERIAVTVLSLEITRQLETPEGLARAIRQRASQLGGQAGRQAFGRVGEWVGETSGEATGAAWGWYMSIVRRGRNALTSYTAYDSATANVTSIDGMLEAGEVELDRGLRKFQDWWNNDSDRVRRNAERGAYMRFPVNTPASGNDDTAAVYSVIQDARHPWVNKYIQQCVDILHDWMRNLPSQTFFRGPLRGAYFDYRNRGPVTDDPEQGTRTSFEPVRGQISKWPPLLGDASSKLCSMIHGRRRNWVASRSSRVTGRNSIESNLLFFEDELMSIAQLVLTESQGEPDFDSVFPGVTEAWMNADRNTAHPTYPDLDLPRHPVSQLVIDTEPDFYFFNDGEEGMLNEIGPELITEIDTRLEKMEGTYARLNSGQEWRETYLGRNRVGISSYNEENGLALNPDPNSQYMGMDGTSYLTYDPSTAEGSQGWGPEGGARQIGGQTASLTGSIVDTVIAQSPTIQGSFSQGQYNQELARRRQEMVRSTTFSLPGGTPSDGIGIGPIDTAIGTEDRSHSFGRNALKSIIQQSIAQAPEETLTMRRAFPSFKIYFVEDDTGAMREHLLPSGGAAATVKPIMYFDDLYNYNSVKSIRLISSRKNPADLLILQLTNVQGLLERRRWTSPNERQRELYLPGFEETEYENPLKKLIMKEGLKVQARLGNTNDPNKMGNKFIGEIVEVSYNAESSDEVTLICQSYGSELVLEKKGLTEGSRTTFVDTPDLLHTLMCSPELVHFGRFDLNPQFNPGEARNAATSRNDQSTDTEGSGIIRDPRAVIQQFQENLIINRSKWILANNPSDDNIFAPGVRDHMTSWERTTNDVGAQIMWGAEWMTSLSEATRSLAFVPLHIATLGSSYIGSHVLGWAASGIRSIGNWLNDAGFSLTGQTIWETLKECELRHPGWIAQPRPYGTRQTLFFGVPSHRYWADQISRQEMVILQRLRSASYENWRNDPAAQYQMATMGMASELNRAGAPLPITQANILRELGTLGGLAKSIYLRTCFEIVANRWMSDIGEYIGSTLGRFRPFRRYHLLTSNNHILINNIRASRKGTFNAVTLQYGDGNIYTLKADDDIPDELTRVQSFHYPSCDNETMARRYCVGLLVRHLKDIYKGEIIVTGMDIDPYDMVYISDDRLGMYGAFEVEQVVHTFTAETGWITEITPDMIVGSNEWSTMSTAQARWAVLGALSEKYLGYRAGTGTVAGSAVAVVGGGAVAGGLIGGPIGSAVGAGVTAAGAAIAWMGGYHIIRWTQDRQPIWVTPLILGERPFFAGLDGFRQDGIFASIRGDLHSSFDAVKEGWRQFHLAGFVNDITLDIARTTAGQ